jgi:hypothetical protein
MIKIFSLMKRFVDALAQVRLASSRREGFQYFLSTCAVGVGMGTAIIVVLPHERRASFWPALVEFANDSIDDVGKLVLEKCESAFSERSVHDDDDDDVDEEQRLRDAVATYREATHESEHIDRIGIRQAVQRCYNEKSQVLE